MTRGVAIVVGLAVLLAALLLWEIAATLSGHRDLPASEHTRLLDGCGTTHEEAGDGR